MLTVRVDNRAAIIAVATGFSIACAWLLVDSPYGGEWFPHVAPRLPDKFWMHVMVNLFVLALGLSLSFLFKTRRQKNLSDLTVWTRKTTCN